MGNLTASLDNAGESFSRFQDHVNFRVGLQLPAPGEAIGISVLNARTYSTCSVRIFGMVACAAWMHTGHRLLVHAALWTASLGGYIGVIQYCM